MKKKKIIYSILLIILLALIGVSGKGVYDYLDWVKTKEAIANSGIPWQCGASKISLVQSGCNRSAMGKCTCAICDGYCEGTTMVQFIPQEVCRVNFACISPQLAAMAKGGPLNESKIGQQAILAGTSNLMTHGVVAVPTLAAENTEKVIDFFKVIIAGFKE